MVISWIGPASLLAVWLYSIRSLIIRKKILPHSDGRVEFMNGED